ncbi:MAG: hypothetical protein WC657_03630 [Candidatus Paceibacterota bacterium]|jgi:hypothetical protein
MKYSAKGAVITIDNAAGSPQDVSTDITSYEIQQDAGIIDVTGFTDGSKNYIPGLPVTGVAFEFLYDTATTSGATVILKGILNSSTSKTVTVKPESAGETLSGEFLLDALTTKGTPDGSIQHGTCHFSVMGSTAPAWA